MQVFEKRPKELLSKGREFLQNRFEDFEIVYLLSILNAPILKHQLEILLEGIQFKRPHRLLHLDERQETFFELVCLRQKDEQFLNPPLLIQYLFKPADSALIFPLLRNHFMRCELLALEHIRNELQIVNGVVFGVIVSDFLQLAFLQVNVGSE